MKKIVFIIVVMLTGAWLTGCSTKKQVVDNERIDSVEVSNKDTVKQNQIKSEVDSTDHFRESTKKERHDRWSQRLIMITPNGDILKDYRHDYEYVERNSELKDSLAKYHSIRDSLDMYKARYDALSKSMLQNKETVVWKEPWWRKYEEPLIFWTVLALIIGFFYIRDK